MGVHKRQREIEELKEHYIKKTSCIMLVVLALLVGSFIGNTITMLYLGQQQAPVASTGVAPAQPEQHTANPVALANLEKAAMDSPTNAELWIKLGNFCFDHNLPVKAINAYERALELSPMKIGVWSDLGVMYRRSQQFNKAIESFKRAASLDPNHVTSRFNMGIVYYHDLGDKQGALKAWNEVLAIDPNAKTPGGQRVSDLIAELQ